MNDAGQGLTDQRGSASVSMMNNNLRPGDMPEDASESPSLSTARPGEPPAYELKFVLDEGQAAELEQHFNSWMSLDPHADALLDHAYRITSLYSDTPVFDVFHRVGAHREHKYRVRQYGDQQQAFLELKTKRGSQVSKHRVAIHGHELHWLVNGDAPSAWSGRWYHQALAEHALRPVCQISYLRRAYFGVTSEGRLRLTFDREIQGALVSDWRFNADVETREVNSRRIICEFKYRGAMPTPFKSAIEQFRLIPQGFSKYRALVEAYGLVSPVGEARA